MDILQSNLQVLDSLAEIVNAIVSGPSPSTDSSGDQPVTCSMQKTNDPIKYYHIDPDTGKLSIETVPISWWNFRAFISLLVKSSWRGKFECNLIGCFNYEGNWRWQTSVAQQRFSSTLDTINSIDSFLGFFFVLLLMFGGEQMKRVVNWLVDVHREWR